MSRPVETGEKERSCDVLEGVEATRYCSKVGAESKPRDLVDKRTGKKQDYKPGTLALLLGCILFSISP